MRKAGLQLLTTLSNVLIITYDLNAQFSIFLDP